MDEILAAIDEALARKGLSDAAASKLAVGNFALIKNLRSSRAMHASDRRTNFHALQRLAEVLDLECYFGPRREPAQPANVDERDFARIPLVDAQLAAGPGAHNGDEEILDHLAFRNDWLKKLGLNPAHAVLARVRGDSMKPTLWPGDTILIDTSHQSRRIEVKNRPPRKGKAPIYAFRTGDDERVKRLIRPDQDTLVVLSDNPEWEPEVFTGVALKRAELGIIGKVVWWGHTSKE